jgi:hypothetical protein
MSEKPFECNCLARTGLEVFFQFSGFDLSLYSSIGSQFDGVMSLGGLHYADELLVVIDDG